MIVMQNEGQRVPDNLKDFISIVVLEYFSSYIARCSGLVYWLNTCDLTDASLKGRFVFVEQNLQKNLSLLRHSISDGYTPMFYIPMDNAWTSSQSKSCVRAQQLVSVFFYRATYC